jgi:hypothetical protein
MSLHGSQGPSTEKPKKSKAGGGFKPAGGSSSSGGAGYTPGGGSSYTPPSAPPSGGDSPSGGFKLPGFGDGAGGGFADKIWGQPSATPGVTASWSDSTRLAVAIGSGVLILAAVALLIFGVASGSKKTATTNPAKTVTTPFNPATTTSGAKTDMPIVFTDGTTADLLYDPSLNLASLGVSLFDSGAENGVIREADQFEIDHGGASFVGSESPAPGQQTYPGPSNSPVPLLSAASNNSGQNVNGNWLDFHFGDWRVGVWEGTGSEKMSTSDDQTWAQNLNGSVSSAGWLTLTGSGPVKLTQFGQPAGPYLVFGNIDSTGMILTPESCTPPVGQSVVNNSSGVPVRITPTQQGQYEGLICLQKANMEADVYGPQSFVQSAMDSLDVQNLKQGPARPSP